MSAYLKIENIGICPPEGFTVLGVSMADTSESAGVIGTFGSGAKHGVAVLLRNELNPIVFAGTLKLEFGTKPQAVSDGLATKEFGRVVVKYGGTDVEGVNRSSTEDLGFVLDYGKQDWNEVSLALREFVSNAIDRSIRERGDWSGVKIEIVEEAQVRAKRENKGLSRLEKMFLEVGLPLADNVELASPPTSAEIKKLLEVATRYGIEIRVSQH